MGIFTALFFVFLGLKLSGGIDWSWWAVFGPLIFDAALGLLLFGGVVVSGFLAYFFGRRL